MAMAATAAVAVEIKDQSLGSKSAQVKQRMEERKKRRRCLPSDCCSMGSSLVDRRWQLWRLANKTEKVLGCHRRNRGRRHERRKKKKEKEREGKKIYHLPNIGNQPMATTVASDRGEKTEKNPSVQYEIQNTLCRKQRRKRERRRLNLKSNQSEKKGVRKLTRGCQCWVVIGVEELPANPRSCSSEQGMESSVQSKKNRRTREGSWFDGCQRWRRRKRRKRRNLRHRPEVEKEKKRDEL